MKFPLSCARLRAAVFLAVLIGSSAAAISQIAVDTTLHHAESEAQRWLEAKSYHVARRYLAAVLERVRGTESERNIVFLLARASYLDKDYEESFNRAGDLIGADLPGDRSATVLFIHGVSAFQTKRPRLAVESLTKFLAAAPADTRQSEAYYWRALSFLDLGDWTAAESDLDSTYNDVVGLPYRDHALMGYALSAERRGEYDRAADKLRQLLADFPSSEIRPDAQIRLASISLRQNHPEKTLELVGSAKPRSDSQREEALLLRAEASYRLGDYSGAQRSYASFVDEFSGSPRIRKAMYGLAWARLRQGDRAGAQAVFDTLSRGTDSLAYASMFQSGVISLLQSDDLTAMARFDNLIDKSPFDQYQDEAYLQRGLIHYRNKDYRSARREFSSVTRLYPESPASLEAWRMDGECCMALRDFPNAVYAFGKMRKLGATGQPLADGMFQEGVGLYHVGRFRSSADRLTEYLQQFPRDARADVGYVWLGEALYQDGRFGEAERAYQNALRLFPDNPKREDAMYGAAWTLFEQKKFNQAADAFEKFTTAYPGSPRNLEASLRRGDCYYFMGQYDKSSAIYASLENLKGDSRTVQYAAFQVAMSYIERGDADRGIEHLRNFLIKYPESVYAEVAQFNIGWTYFSKDQFTEAVGEFRTFTRQYPESQIMPRVLFNTGDAFFNLKSYDSARVYYQRVVREYPSSALVSDALAGLGYVAKAQGRPSQAISDIDTLMQAHPEGLSEEDLHLRKAGILFENGDYTGALPEYNRILSLKPSRAVQAKASYQLGRIYDLQNNPSRAVAYYQQALAAPVDSEVGAPSTLALALAHLKLKQYRDAAADLRDFDTKFPDSPLRTEARYHLGEANAGIPNTTSAMSAFESVIRDNPGDVFADRSRLRIAEMRIGEKQYGAAIDTLNALLNRRSDDLAADALLMIGDVYLSQRKYREALQAYHDVIQQYTDFPLRVEKGRYGLGQTYEKMNDKKQARLAYEDIVKAPVDPEMKANAEQRLKKLKR